MGEECAEGLAKERSRRQLASCVGLGWGERLCEGFGYERRTGTERSLCLCLGGRVGQVGGVGHWFSGWGCVSGAVVVGLLTRGGGWGRWNSC